eukprot:GILK01001235.1.p1 GENE.GILK01001235.1~~GILK01001235.1.p1  ORF type:complete len:505 (-),score=112.88 GILK01001235.1:169-1653(-)
MADTRPYGPPPPEGPGFDYERSRRESRRDDRDGDRDRRDGHRDRDRDRDGDRDRGDRYRERDRERDRDRHRDRDSERDRRDSRSSRSKEPRSKSRSRSRSRSPPRRERVKKRSNFDQPPGAVSNFSGPVSNFSMGPPGGVPVPMDQQQTLQHTRHARRVYLGNIPVGVNEGQIKDYWNVTMTAAGAASVPNDCVISVYINHEKRFAFVEMRTVEETNLAMELDGVNFAGHSLKVRRPNDYNPVLAAQLVANNKKNPLNVNALGIVSTQVEDGPNKMFVGGLPHDLTEDQVKELLQSFGQLKSFHLVKERDKDTSKGYAFCEYMESAATDAACIGLNGLQIGNRTLTVRRAQTNAANSAEQLQQLIQQAQVQASALDSLPYGLPFDLSAVAPQATRVLCLLNMVSEDELQDDQEFADIMEDTKEECTKFGQVLSITIPRPGQFDTNVAVGKIFVEYNDTDSATRASNALSGRKFGGRVVECSYYSEDRYAARDFS